MSRRLLELAALKEATVNIEGEELRIREPNGLQMMEYRSRRLTNLPDAVAYLISVCVIETKDGADVPVYSFDQAKLIANGHAKVFTPLIVAITAFNFDSQKKS